MNKVREQGMLFKNKAPKNTRLQQGARIGLLFLSPWLIGFVLLKALPILAALLISLTNFKMLPPETTKFIGFENYSRFFKETRAGSRLVVSVISSRLTVHYELL